MAADVPSSASLFRHQLEAGPVIGLSSMGLVRGEPFNFTKTGIVLYCVSFPVLKCWPEQLEQELTAVDSNGVRLRVRSVRLWKGLLRTRA